MFTFQAIHIRLKHHEFTKNYSIIIQKGTSVNSELKRALTIVTKHNG